MHLAPDGKKSVDNIIDNPPTDRNKLHKLNVELGHLLISRGKALKKKKSPNDTFSPEVL